MAAKKGGIGGDVCGWKKSTSYSCSFPPSPPKKKVGKGLISFLSGPETEMGLEKNGRKNSVSLRVMETEEGS